MHLTLCGRKKTSNVILTCMFIHRSVSSCFGNGCFAFLNPLLCSWVISNPCWIDFSQGVWLTVDLTNHNTEFTIFSDEQIRQESRLTSVDFNLKTVYWRLFHGGNKITFDVHSRLLVLCLYLSKEEEMISSRTAWICHDPGSLSELYESWSRQIKEPQNDI